GEVVDGWVGLRIAALAPHRRRGRWRRRGQWQLRPGAVGWRRGWIGAISGTQREIRWKRPHRDRRSSSDRGHWRRRRVSWVSERRFTRNRRLRRRLGLHRRGGGGGGGPPPPRGGRGGRRGGTPNKAWRGLVTRRGGGQ